MKVYATDASGIDTSRSLVQLKRVETSSSDSPHWQSAFLFKTGEGEYTATFQVDNSWISGEYEFSMVMVDDIYGNSATLFKNQNTVMSTVKYTVDSSEQSDETPAESPKPSETVTPSESSKPSESTTPVSKVFSDVPVSGKWYSEAVYYVAEKGYMDGTGNNKFNPIGTVTRGTIAQILYAAEGKPAVSDSSKFADVKAGKWYANAVNWAADNGLVSGYGKGIFKPEDPVTREQMVAIMYKYSEMKGFDLTATADLSKFADQSQVSKWAINSMKWGVDHKIISGTNKGIEPKGNATRAQIAVILQAYDNNVRK